jgi:inner membrane transporter RhtA
MKGLRNTTLLPVAFILAAAFSVQGGAAIAKGLFPQIGVPLTVAARIALSAAILLAIYRPPLREFTGRQWRAVIPFGITIGVMNLCFYQALSRIPLGLAVTLEFVGPLGVAIAGSRRALDVFWVVLAAAGIFLIAPIQSGSTIDPLGVVFALLAGACWAIYIVIGGRVSMLVNGGFAVSTGMAFGALAVLPYAIAAGDIGRFTPGLLIPAVAMAVLSSALPYALEMKALAVLPGRTFSILMSLEPAIAALCGVVLLSEHLTPAQWAAVALVIAASVGAASAMAGSANRALGT